MKNKESQVLNFEPFKRGDLFGLEKELLDRIGSGNYDEIRTKLNHEFVSFDRPLKNYVYAKLYQNNITYSDTKKVNFLEGATVSSSIEFFQSLGLPVKDSGRVYGKKDRRRGQPIMVPDIKSEEDIPPRVMEFFEYANEFLKQEFGEENVVYSCIHFDEDVPHLQFYALPVVSERKTKDYEKDENGKIKTKIIKDKKGNEKEVPVQKRDENGKLIYNKEQGKFLSREQFQKQKGGQNSYSKFQDRFNEFMKEKGFDLDRGEVGANKKHTSKLEWENENLKEENKELINTNKELTEKNKTLTQKNSELTKSNDKLDEDNKKLEEENNKLVKSINDNRKYDYKGALDYIKDNFKSLLTDAITQVAPKIANKINKYIDNISDFIVKKIEGIERGKVREYERKEKLFQEATADIERSKSKQTNYNYSYNKSYEDTKEQDKSNDDLEM